MARSPTELGLIDEYRIDLHPVVLGHGKPYFARVSFDQGSAITPVLTIPGHALV